MSVKSINSVQAYELLTLNESKLLVDVRTPMEWNNIGVPYLINEKQILFLSWQLPPFMNLNENFAFAFILAVKDRATDVFFLCRSGYRSLAAASFMTDLGYKNCYNITSGFEGNNLGTGWKQNNLPWQRRV